MVEQIPEPIPSKETIEPLNVRSGDSVTSHKHFSGRSARVIGTSLLEERPSVHVILVNPDGTHGLAGGEIYIDEIDTITPGNEHTRRETEKILSALTIEPGSTQD